MKILNTINFTPEWIAIKKPNYTQTGENVQLLLKMYISMVTLENRSLIKNQNILSYDPAVLSFSIQQKESKSDYTRNTCTRVPTQFTAVNYRISPSAHLSLSAHQ